MAYLLNNLYNGFRYRIKKIFHRPFSVFNIGWTKEKILKHQTGKKLRYHLYKKKYKVAFTESLTFLMSIEELFIKEFYKFKTDKRRPKIIDCGSYIGTSILFFKINYPDADVIGFEPDKTNYSILKLNTDNWKFRDIVIFNAAIWITDGNISFNSAGNMSSKIEMNSGVVDEKSNIKCVRLKNLLNEEIDFLKIDIEGAEFAVLNDCADNLKNVNNLFIEYHGNYNEMFKLNGILDILLKAKFKYYIKEGNAVYDKPLWERDKKVDYDMLLNIFAFKD